MGIDKLSCNHSLSFNQDKSSSYLPKEDLGLLLASDAFFKEDNDGEDISLEFKNMVNEISNAMGKKAQGYIFNTFSFMFKFLSNIQSGKEGDLQYLLSLLDELEYDSCSDIDTYGGGNCVDFALKLKKYFIETFGVPLNIIGVYPKSKYSDMQKSFMKFRHVSLCYNNNGFYALFEPSWRHYSPIILNSGYVSCGDNFSFKTLNVGDDYIEQQVTLLKSKSPDVRRLSLHEVTDSDCQNLTKRLTRIPRKLEIINSVAGEKMSFISFSPENKGILKISIEGNIVNKGVDQITSQENYKLSEMFFYDNIKGMLQELLHKYYNITNSFRIQ